MEERIVRFTNTHTLEEILEAFDHQIPPLKLTIEGEEYVLDMQQGIGPRNNPVQIEVWGYLLGKGSWKGSSRITFNCVDHTAVIMPDPKGDRWREAVSAQEQLAVPPQAA